MNAPPSIDWSAVCLHLRSRYKPLTAVANEVGSNWWHLNRLARGEVQQPRFDTGMRLLDLHRQHCPELHQPEMIMAERRGRLR